MITNEKRLIDANAMREDWLENGENEYVYGTNAVLDSIDTQPTVDAVEVVRCKDCKHCIYISYACGDVRCGKLHTDYIRENDFCSYGERKDNE